MVIKQCKNTLDEKNRGRWLEEIHWMNTIKHKNVVGGLPIPIEIEQFIMAPEKLLGLEFCESDVFVNSALKIQCHVVDNTLLQTAFSVILPTGKNDRLCKLNNNRTNVMIIHAIILIMNFLKRFEWFDRISIL